MFKITSVVIVVSAMASNAFADTVTITNGTDQTIYALYAWPSDLAAHTLNLLGYPLSPGSSQDIEVDTSYGLCQFTIETNPNDPADKKKPKKRFTPRKDIELRYIDICKAAGHIDIQPEVEGL